MKLGICPRCGQKGTIVSIERRLRREELVSFECQNGHSWVQNVPKGASDEDIQLAVERQQQRYVPVIRSTKKLSD